MTNKMKKILRQKWQFSIARNVPVWHNELTNLYALEGYKRFGLPFLCQLRVHYGTRSEFYYLSSGSSGREQFAERLMKKLSRPAYIKFLERKYKADGKKLIQMSKKLGRFDYKSWKNFFRFYGLCISMLDITAYGSKLVTDKMMGLVKNYKNREKIISYYSRSRHLVPIQELERDLDKLHNRKINVLVEAKKLHNKYAWIPLNFVAEPWTVDYFANLIKKHHPSESSVPAKPKDKISKQTKYWLDLLAVMAYLNEYRKAVFSQVSFIIRLHLDKIAREHGLKSWKNLSLLAHGEILDLLIGKDKYQKKLLAKRKLCALYNKTVDKVEFVYGKEVLKFEKKFKPKASNVTEVRGVVANKGRIRGKVKIVSGPVDFFKFKSGDILVAKMTSVDFMPIMKKASAFVTDEGGLACHAAIVSREYNKPCIVGTGLASYTFKDGDVVEVDAEKGIVKKIG